MTNTVLKAQIDSQITTKTAANSITPAILGANVKEVIDYIDQQAPLKISGQTTLTSTQQVLTKDINSVNFSGGKCYLPTTTIIGKEIIVISNSDNIEIFSNVANTAKTFLVFGTFINKITAMTNDVYKFTYVGFLTEGYWMAQKI